VGGDIEGVDDAGAGCLEVLVHAGDVRLEFVAVLIDKLASSGEILLDRMHAGVASAETWPTCGSEVGADGGGELGDTFDRSAGVGAGVGAAGEGVP
jgi:hypothetical protein